MKLTDVLMLTSGRPITFRDVLGAALVAIGPAAELVDNLEEDLARSDEEGYFRFADEAFVQTMLLTWRRARAMEAAEDVERFLADANVSLSQFSNFFSRANARSISPEERATIPPRVVSVEELVECTRCELLLQKDVLRDILSSISLRFVVPRDESVEEADFLAERTRVAARSEAKLAALGIVGRAMEEAIDRETRFALFSRTACTEAALEEELARVQAQRERIAHSTASFADEATARAAFERCVIDGEALETITEELGFDLVCAAPTRTELEGMQMTYVLSFASVGYVSPPVHHDGAWHVLRVDQRIPASLDDAETRRYCEGSLVDRLLRPRTFREIDVVALSLLSSVRT